MNQPINITLLFLLLLLSCNKQQDKLKQSLTLAKNNKPELQKTLDHFADDSFHYQAMRFLIENMSDKYSIEGEIYNAYRDTIRKYYQDTDSLAAVFDNMKKHQYEETKVPDITSISSEYLINHVEQAFNVYQQAPWKDKIKFEHFCKYILPYRVRNETLENWHADITKNPQDSFLQTANLIAAATGIVQKYSTFKEDFDVRWGANNPGITDIPHSLLEKLQVGSCDELSSYITFVLRAHAIPCARDFTPNYANLGAGHQWTAIIIAPDTSLPFDFPMDVDTLGKFKYDHFKLAKVYRNTFSDNPASHANQRGERSFLPDLFNNRYIMDVTNQYTSVSDVEIPVKIRHRPKPKFAYLAIFNNNTWVPVAWGKVKRNKAMFDNIGTDIVCLPLAMEEKGSYGINYPFIPNSTGDVTYLVPNNDHLISLEMERKYPLFPHIQQYIDRMIGGKFQVANKPDFSDAVTLYEVTEDPGTYFNNIVVTNDKKFRYIRYIGGEESYCNIAEIEFYGAQQKEKPLTGAIIGTEGAHIDNPSQTKAKTMDGDVLTYFDAPVKDYAWVGLDLGHKQNIDSIRFIARTDYNIIVPGNLYEAFYWDNQWVSLGKKEADSHVLTYDNVPSNALYYIKNHTAGREERIFTYENGEPVWW